jgi:hypothetical protein
VRALYCPLVVADMCGHFTPSEVECSKGDLKSLRPKDRTFDQMARLHSSPAGAVVAPVEKAAS